LTSPDPEIVERPRGQVFASAAYRIIVVPVVLVAVGIMVPLVLVVLGSCRRRRPAG
jgi:hypothetical protein